MVKLGEDGGALILGRVWKLPERTDCGYNPIRNGGRYKCGNYAWFVVQRGETRMTSCSVHAASALCLLAGVEKTPNCSDVDVLAMLDDDGR